MKKKTDILETCVERVNERSASARTEQPPVVYSLSTDGSVPNHIDVPEWYHPIKRKHAKIEHIKRILNEYNQPFIIDGKEHGKPSEKDIIEYESILSGLKLEKLAQMGVVMKYNFKLDIMDRLKSRNRKEHAVVTIFNDNKTSDTGVIHCYNRTFSRRGMCYLVMNERGIYDPEFQMTHFYYYANQSCPILFQKGKLPENAYDAKLIDATIEMKVIEALAAIDIEKWIKIILVCVILSLLMNLLNIAKGLKGSGIPIIGG